MPTSVDPKTGAAILGSQEFAIFDQALSIFDSSPSPSQMFDMGFRPGTHGQPILAYGLGATWCYAAAGFAVQEKRTDAFEQHIAQLETQLLAAQQTLRQVGELTQGILEVIGDMASGHAIRGFQLRHLQELQTQLQASIRSPRVQPENSDTAKKPAPD